MLRLLFICALSVASLAAQSVGGGIGKASSGGGGGTPASPANSVQVNNAGAFGGDANLTYLNGTLTGQAKCTLGTVLFTGTGTNDMTRVGTYVGPALAYSPTMQFVVQIDATGTPDTFKWSPNGGGLFRATGVAITGADQYLENGVSVHFASTTGHVLHAEWAFTYAATVPIHVQDAAGTKLLDLDANGATTLATQNQEGDAYTLPTAVQVIGTNNSSLAGSLAQAPAVIAAQNSGTTSSTAALVISTENDGATGSLTGVAITNYTFTGGAVAADSEGVSVAAEYGPGAFTVHSGVDVKTPQQDDVAGTIGTLYGLRVRDQSAAAGVTTNYNISSEGALSKNRFAGTVQINAAAFATLTACAAGLEGTMKPVSDSSTATWGATITGGGANHVLGYCNGTNWTVAAK
jgi:hypothetical protein